MQLELRGIGEEELARSAPMVRALVVQRLEQLWSVCQPHVDGTVDRPDPRFVEAGIRVTDRLIRMYRLDQPAAHVEDPDARPVDPAALVAAGLRELRDRMGA